MDIDSFYGRPTSEECNYCSKMLPSHAELVEHKKIHVGDRPFSCNICTKTFTQKAHLNIHKRTHTGEKPYACHVCHKRFAQSSHLNSHKRIHTLERPFFCVVCNTGFSQKHRFDAHLPCMQQAQSARAAGGAGAIASGAGRGYMTTDQQALASSASASAAAAFALSGGGSDGDAGNTPDRKPDIAFLNSLNQSLMQQLADLSQSTGTGAVGEDSLGGDGPLGVNPLAHAATGTLNSTDGSMLKGVKEEGRGWGTVSSAYVPASSTHRRKPAFIRRVDNDGGEDSSMSQTADGDNNTTVNSTHNSFQDTDYDEESTDFDDENADVSFENGAQRTGRDVQQNNVRGQDSGPFLANTAVLSMRISTRDQITNGNIGLGDRADSSLADQVRTNPRISLVNFTAEELLAHLMSRADIHRCEFCRLIFQDAAMYHIHRNMHDKNDLRCCNFCGKLLQDKYDFTAHFLNEHR